MLHDHAATIAADIAALADCSLFDAGWYRVEYPDSVAGGRDALLHFCDIGWRQGCKPNPWFDPAFYLDQNSDVRDIGRNPLRHYLDYGEAEGRCPSPGFDPNAYRALNTDIRDAGLSPLAHFLAYGAAEGRDPCPRLVLLPDHHSEVTAEETVLGGDPYDLIDSSGLFDVDFYLSSYPDVRGSGQDPLTHFLDFGCQEGRRPNPYFDPGWYRRHYLAGRADATQNPLLHYITQGERHAFRPILYFETEWYRRSYRLADGQSPLLHYLRERRSQRFSPLSYFDVGFYMRQWGHEVGRNRDPFAHFLRVGITRDVDPSPALNMAQYRATVMPGRMPPPQPQPGAEFLEKIRREQFNPLIFFLSQHILNDDARTIP